MIRFLFIRHGQTEVNVEGRMHRLFDEEGLSDVGKEQAGKLVGVCRKNGVGMVVCSAERRAVETAGIVGDGLRLAVREMDDLHERNWGEWEGKRWEEIKVELDKMSIEERYLFKPSGGESWKEMEERLKSSLEKIVSWCEIKSVEVVAVVTHGGALRGLMPILLNLPKESSLRFDFANAAVTIFDYVDGGFKEVAVNGVGHLGDLNS